MLPVINIGPLAVQTPGLILILGIWFSLLILEKLSHKFDMDANTLSNLSFWFLISMVIFARIGYIAQYPSIFLERPLSMLSPNPGMFDVSSGLIFASIVFFIFVKQKKLDPLHVLNAFTPSLAFFLLFYFVSFFASGNYYGSATNVPWSIFLWGTKRHPLQLYYVLGLLIIGTLAYSRINNKDKQLIFIKFMRDFSILVIFLDYFRGDNEMIIFNIHILQMIAFLVLIAVIVYSRKISMQINRQAA